MPEPAPPDTIADGVSSTQVHIEGPSRELTVKDSRPTNHVKLGTKIPGVKVISRFEDLTTEWLTEVFRFRGLLPANGSIDEMVLKRIGEGQGAMSELVAITIVKATNSFVEDRMPTTSTTATRTTPTYLVAKIWPEQAGKSVGGPPPIALKLVFFAESHFYNDFTVAAGGLPRPECLHCGAAWRWTWSNAPAKFILLLEDASRGLYGVGGPSRQYMRVDGCASLEHLTMVMVGLARFHARWWGKTRDKALPKWIHPTLSTCGLGPNFVTLIAKQGVKLLPKLASEMKHADGTNVATFGKEFAFIVNEWHPRLVGHFRYIVRQLLRPPLTLIHGDCHLENVFFHERYPGGCAFIDFGNMHFGHALADVSFLLTTNLEPEVRRELEKTLLQRYHAALVQHGVNGYPFERCWHDYQMNIYMVWCQIVTQAPDFVKMRKARAGMFAPEGEITEGSASLLKMCYAQNRRLAIALKDHDWISLVTSQARQPCDLVGCTPAACVKT